MSSKAVLSFLQNLKENNSRPWFHANKPAYRVAKGIVEELANTFIDGIALFDKDAEVVTPKESMFRIFRDVRFSKDKCPYKTNFGCYIAKGGRRSGYAGYYFHIEPGNSFMGAGLYRPSPPILKAIRTHIDQDSCVIDSILQHKTLRTTYGTLEGERLTRVPKGFSKDAKSAELLKLKSYLVLKKITDEAIFEPQGHHQILDDYKAAYPFIQYLNQIIAEVIANPFQPLRLSETIQYPSMR
ncbi:MAG: DUF2461 domain-containing protein [Cytophagales bacterium]